MSTVVVLNASFEPLGVVPLHRAMLYIFRERVTVVEAVPGATYRSATEEFPIPRVVQFRHMVRVPYRKQAVPWTRRGVLDRDGRICAYCSGRALTVDHIQPKSKFKGNPNTWMNTVACCGKCNNKKADRNPDQAGMALLYQPRVVTSKDTLLMAIIATGADLPSLGIA